MGQPTKTVNLNSQNLMVQKLGSLHGTDLGPRHVCDNIATWCLSKASNSDRRACFWHLADFW